MAETEKITGYQFFWLQVVAGTGLFMVVMPRTLISLAGSSAWLVPLAGALVILPLLVWLSKRLPWTQRQAMSPGLALLVIGISLLEGALALRRYGEFFNISIMPETPITVIMALTLLMAAVLARGGLMLLVRFNLLCLPLLIISVVAAFVLSYPDFQITRLRPWLVFEPEKTALAVAVSAGLISNMMPVWVLAGQVRERPGKRGAYLFIAAPLSLAVQLSFSNLLILGIFGVSTSQRLLWPLLDVIKNISLAGFIERIEVSYILIWFYVLVIRLGLFLYLSGRAVEEWLKLKSYKVLVLPLGLFILAISMLPTNFSQIIRLNVYQFLFLLAFLPGFIFLLSRRKAQLLAGLLILLLVFSTGCWNRKEAEKIQYALAVGVDKTVDGQVLLTVQMPLQEKWQAEKGVSGPKAWTISSRGETTFEAIRHLIFATGAKLFFSHMQVLVIGQKAAKDGVDKYLDIFSSDQEFRATPYILVSRGTAREVLSTAPPNAPIPANFLKDQVEKVAFGTSSAPKVKLGDFFAALSSQGAQAPWAPEVDMHSWEEYVTRVLNFNEGSRGQLDPRVVVRMAGSGVFNGTKLAGWLNTKETRGVLWVKGKVQSGIIVVPQPEGGKISFEIIRIQEHKLSTAVRNGQPVIRLKLLVEGNLGEKSGYGTGDQTNRGGTGKGGYEGNQPCFSQGTALPDGCFWLWGQIGRGAAGKVESVEGKVG